MDGSAKAPSPPSKRPRSDAAATARDERARVPVVLLGWLIDRMRAEKTPWRPGKRPPLDLETAVMGGAMSALLQAGIGGAEHAGAIVDIFRSNACALEDLSEDCSYEYEREHKRMFETASSALKHLPSAAVSPHFQQLLIPLERKERTSRRRERARDVQLEVMTLAIAHSQPFLSLLAEPGGVESQTPRQQQQQQQPPPASEPSVLSTPEQVLDTPSVPNAVDRATLDATLKAYTRVLEDSLWLACEKPFLSRYCYGHGERQKLFDSPMSTLRTLPRSLVTAHADLVAAAILPTVARDMNDTDCDRLPRVLQLVPDGALLPAHAHAVMKMLRAASVGQKKGLEAAVLALLRRYQQDGGALGCLAPSVGELIGVMEGRAGAEGTSETDRFILELLAGIPRDAFGPEPAVAEEGAAQAAAAAAGGDGGGNDGDDGGAVARWAAESLLGLMRCEKRGGLLPNRGRTKALRTLPLACIFQPRMKRVFKVLGEMRTAHNNKRGGSDDMVRAAYKALNELPAAWLVEPLLDVCLKQPFRDDRLLIDVVLVMVNEERGKELSRAMSEHAKALLDKIVAKGPDAALELSSYPLLSVMGARLTREAWEGLKGSIVGMQGSETGLILMHRLYGKSPPLVTEAEMDAAIAAALRGVEYDPPLLARALDVCAAVYDDGRRRRGVVEPYMHNAVEVVNHPVTPRHVGVLEQFCSLSSGLRPLLLDHLGDIVPWMMRRTPLSQSASLSGAIRSLMTLPPRALEPYVGDVVKLLERAADSPRTLHVQAAALELLEALPARATKDYTTHILRAYMTSAQAAASRCIKNRDEDDYAEEEEEEEEEDFD